MNFNEWPKEAKEILRKILNEQGFHKAASMISLDEDLQFKQLVEMAKDERTVKDELIKEVMSAVTEEHLKLFDEYSKMKAEEEAARHETIMINRKIAEHQLDKVNEEAGNQPQQQINNKRYSIPTGYVDKIKKIYTYLFDTRTINVCEEYFLNSIIQADFSGIFPNSKKHNLFFAIENISRAIEGNWFEDVATSINKTKRQIRSRHPSKSFIDDFPTI